MTMVAINEVKWNGGIIPVDKSAGRETAKTEHLVSYKRRADIHQLKFRHRVETNRRIPCTSQFLHDSALLAHAFGIYEAKQETLFGGTEPLTIAHEETSCRHWNDLRLIQGLGQIIESVNSAARLRVVPTSFLEASTDNVGFLVNHP